MRPERIPLFPLNVVLLPGADLPLHIFEPRYRRMVRNCVKNRTEFGMLLALPNGIAGIGCTAEVVKICKRYHDGRMDILTAGRTPFRVVELFEDDPLLEGTVDYLEDHPGASDSPVQRRLVELYEVCHTLIHGDYPRDSTESLATGFSYRIAEKLPLDLLWKQALLELRTETERQERLVAYLRAWAPHLQKVEAARQSTDGSHGLN